MAWGLWRVPESELKLLGDVRGRDILEIGCGAARWSIALARAGARPVGIDQSTQQLARARELLPRRPPRPGLVRADAERLPFADGRFDIAFCDWGAITFCDPYRTIPEASRVLRPGGLLVFANSSPFRNVTQSRAHDFVGRRLLRPYFGLGRLEYPNEVNFNLTYGEWIRLFREQGLIVDRLVETRPPPGAKSRYLLRREAVWARSWPMECLWRLRKES